ncbi:MAG TPA: hemolysin family protein, partial [Nitrospiria bacterium]
MLSGWLEVAAIFLLIGVNGFFACSEIAIIAVRRSRIKQLMEQGDRRAESVHHLQENSEQFLATIQIGVTVVSSLAAAIGGVFAVKKLEPLILQIPNPAVRGMSEFLAVGMVVMIISYFSLIIGELVPKSLALRYSETIALGVARPIGWMSRFASSFTKILTRSSGFILQFFKGSPTSEKTFVSEEEIKILVQEGREKGIFDETEMKLIHGVFEFTDISVKEVMVPRHKMQALKIDTSPEELLEFISSHKFSRYPVFRESMNEIVGVLYFKDVMEQLIKKEEFTLESLVRPAFFVPETMKINHLLRELQRRKIQMAIVVNEYGNVEG